MKVRITLFTVLMLTFGLNISNAQSIFWSEDFSDSDLPAGWTSEDASGGDAVWTWCGDPNSGQGGGCPGVYTGQTPFASTTAANGFATMDSDIIGQQTTNHIAQLTTTAIDCSGQTEVWVKFESFIGVFANTTVDNAVLRVSTNLTDWTSYNLYDTPAGDFSENPELSLVDITTVAAGSATVYLQWEWDGNYEYNWNIDDVDLYDGDPSNIFIAAHDMRVNANFFGVSPNAMWPSSQLECFSFLADIENVGFMEQTGVNLNISINEVGGGVVYTDDLFYGTISSDSLAENQPFEDCYTPDGAAGTMYEGTYLVTADSIDEVPDNNTQTFSFMVSDTTFAKETGATGSVTPADSNWDDGEAHSWAYGNHYYIVNGDNYDVSSATFSIGAPSTALVGRLLEIALYKWDEDANSTLDNNMDPDERTKVGSAFYEITGEETINDLITIPLNVPPNLPGPIDVESGGHYVIMVEYNTNDQNDLFIATSDAINYGAMSYRSELPEDGIAGPASRYAGLLGVNDPLTDEPYSSVGFGQDLVPVVRLNLLDNTISTKNLLSDFNVLEIAPNPANNKINVSIDLVENQEIANIRIFDINGKLLLDRELEDLKKQVIEFDVSDYTSGTYFLHLITDDGVKTERFVVQH